MQKMTIQKTYFCFFSETKMVSEKLSRGTPGMCSSGQDNGTSRGTVIEKTAGYSHWTVARHLRERPHPSMFVVTIREGEERGICSTALKELFELIKDQIKDQIKERGVVVLVFNKESAIRKDASMKIGEF